MTAKDFREYAEEHLGWAKTARSTKERQTFLQGLGLLCASVLGAASGRLYRRGMSSFDYNAPAELFLFKPAKGSRTKYRRFATAAEALRYAVEDLRTPKAFGGAL